MKRYGTLFIVILCGIIITSQACTVTNEPVDNPLIVQTSTPTNVLSAAPELATLTPTSPPEPTATPLPSPTVLLLPTSTPTLFLPPGLEVISPQNAQELKQVASLSDQSASVVAFTPDSRLIAAGSFRTDQVKIWELSSGRELLTLSGHNTPRILSYLAFSPDGLRLASGAQGWDAPNDSLVVWDTTTGRELQRFEGELGALSPDWRLVALTRRELEGQAITLVLSDLTSGEALHTLEAPSDIYGVSFSPNGQQVAAKMYHVIQDLFSFWLVDTGQLIRTQYDWVGFSYSPDGRYIAALVETRSGRDKGELNIFDANTFKWIKTQGKNADTLWFTYPVFSPDGQVLAASFGEYVTLWETQNWQELVSLLAPAPTGLAFSPDGRILTTYTQSGPVQFWGVAGEQ